MPIEVTVEATGKRAFAGALEWPGWCRSGRDEDAALEALFEYSARYTLVLEGSGVRFPVPARASTLKVVERAKGDATTDFGAPSIPARAEAAPIDRRWLTRNEKILRACWAAFDRAVEGTDRPLETGPRGGGRQVDAIVEHVVGAEGSYLRMIEGRPPPDREGEAAAAREVAAIAAREEERAAVLDGLERALVDGIPEKGPRGGARWTARYFVRRAAWHVLDHAWEIQDRSSAGD